MFKTFHKKAADVAHKWVLIDVSGLPVGRAATVIARRLSAKYDPSYTPHIDSGDNVVVINADKLVFKGDLAAKKYFRHSGFAGALKEKSAADMPLSEILRRAVRGMLPKNKLAAGRLNRLKIFADAEHNHTAQQPEKLEVK
jgi:large subunit ribosomal protein L13